METSPFSIGSVAQGGTRHPFRATLPKRVLRELPRLEPEVAQAQALAQKVPAPSVWRITTQDVKDFLIAYCACLLAAMTFFG